MNIFLKYKLNPENNFRFYKVIKNLKIDWNICIKGRLKKSENLYS